VIVHARAIRAGASDFGMWVGGRPEHRRGGAAVRYRTPTTRAAVPAIASVNATVTVSAA
jgi:hypothetical protein